MGCLESWSEMLWRVFFPSAFCKERRLLCVEKFTWLGVCALSDLWKTTIYFGHFGFVSVKLRQRQFNFENLRFNMLKRKTGVFNFFEERCRKAPFSWRISVDGRPTGEIKLRGLRFFFLATVMEFYFESGKLKKVIGDSFEGPVRHHTGRIWTLAYRPQIDPSRKRSFLRTLFKPDGNILKTRSVSKKITSR